MPKDEQFNKPNLPVAVLLEGNFTSAFISRKPTAKLLEQQRIGNGVFKEKGETAKMIVIGDGDMIKIMWIRKGKYIRWEQIILRNIYSGIKIFY